MEAFSFVAPTASLDGYGSSAEALALAAVREHGASIQFVEHDWQDARFTDPELLEMAVHESEIRYRNLCVVYFLPYALARYRSDVTLLQTMFETDRLPDRWAEIISDCADGVIVPSEHCRESVAAATLRPVEVVPYGTDTGLYSFCEREERQRPEFTFAMAGALHYRKGLDFALRAFVEEFHPSEPVALWLKTRRGFLDWGDYHHALCDPRVRVLDEDYTRQQMRDFYHYADCLLAPSRGEGSGLTPRDAMATGLPVVLTDWSGLAELADERYAYPIAVDALEEAPAENSSYGRGVTGGGPIGRFARPSIPALRAAMRAVYEDRAAGLARGRAAAGWMRREWTWGQCSARWLRAIEALAERARERVAA